MFKRLDEKIKLNLIAKKLAETLVLFKDFTVSQEARL